MKSQRSQQHFPPAKRRRIKAQRRRPAYQGPVVPYGKGESKFYDFSSSVLNLTTAGQLSTASAALVAAGTGESQRIGRKIFVTKIMLRGVFKQPNSTAIADGHHQLRIIVFHDKQHNKNGVAVTGSQLLAADQVESFRNLDNSRRFTFLCDETFDLNVMAAGHTGSTDRVAEVGKSWFIYKDVNIPIVYDSTAGAITELTENNIGVMVWCGPFTSTAPQITYAGRIRYTD